MIYFVLCREANAVKIGHTSEVKTFLLYKRVSMIQGGCPLRLELVRVREGYLADERALHARFADCQIHGEWFWLTDELQQYMDTCDLPPERPAPSKVGGKRREWRENNRAHHGPQSDALTSGRGLLPASPAKVSA